MHDRAGMTPDKVTMWAGPLPPVELEEAAIEPMLWAGPLPPDGAPVGRKERKGPLIGFVSTRALEAQN
jgi:hypothetical protein